MWQSDPEVVHPVPVDAVEGFSRAIGTAFLDDSAARPGEEQLEKWRRLWDAQRTWGVCDDGRWVASLKSLDRTLTVPGLAGATRVIAADAVTAVTVAATHRRRGLMSAMLVDALRAARDRGDPVSILTAAEWPIYGRFGYAPAAFGAHYAFHVRRRGAAIAGDLTRVRQVDLDGYGEAAPAVFEAARRRRAGQVDRGGDWWNSVLGRNGWPASRRTADNLFLHEGSDGPDGLLVWAPPGGSFPFVSPLATVQVVLLAAATDDAERDLWAYLSGIDGVEQVLLRDRPIDEPARWLLGDGRTLMATEQRDHLWLRLLDVPAALSARRYAVAGEAVLEVRDEGVVSVAGRYRLRADGEQVHCEPTTDAPDLTLDQTVLAAIYLGGFGLAELILAGGMQEHTRGSVARVQTMFSTPLAPWNATSF